MFTIGMDQGVVTGMKGYADSYVRPLMAALLALLLAFSAATFVIPAFKELAIAVIFSIVYGISAFWLMPDLSRELIKQSVGVLKKLQRSAPHPTQKLQ